MLGVSWNGLGKRFGLRWVFRNQIGSISLANTSLSKDQTVPVKAPLENY